MSKRSRKAVHKSTDGARGASHAGARQAVGPVGSPAPLAPDDLAELLMRCRLSSSEAAEFLGVTLRSLQRWRHSGGPVWVGHLLRYRAGDPPWQGWEGWQFGDGVAYPPGYVAEVTPGQIMAVPFRLQLIADLKRQVREFWEMDDQVNSQPLVDRHRS